MQMFKFPSINQFRNVVKYIEMKSRYVGRDENDDAIYDSNKPLPTLEFEGTVKLHGTNAAIVYDVENDSVYYQSRSRIITPEDDNMGFATAMNKHLDLIKSSFNLASSIMPNQKYFILYGEWCGKGIQSGVGISEVDRIFVVFAGKSIDYYDNHIYAPIEAGSESKKADDICLDFISSYPRYNVTIDFNNPHLIQNELIKITEAVEQECPVAKAFGVSGIGEGVVWKCITPGWESNTDTWFKVKGEKHSVSKVKTLAAADVETIENMKAFIESVVTEARLEWVYNDLINEQKKAPEMTSMGDFIRTVFNDIMKEESDTMEANNIDQKKIGSYIASAARPWFNKKIMG